MSDVAWTDSPPAAPPPTAAPSGASSSRVYSDSWSQNDFQQALQQADPGARAAQSGDSGRAESHDDEDADAQAGGKRKDDGDEVDGGGLFGALSGQLGLFAGASLRGNLGAKGQTEGKQGALTALSEQPPGAFVAAPASQAGGEVDFGAFADMLEQVGAGLPAPSQSFQLSLGGVSLPITSVDMIQLPDGSLAMTLGTDSQAVTEVRATLDTLRRRLQARGVNIAELTVTGEVAAGAQQPESA